MAEAGSFRRMIAIAANVLLLAGVVYQFIHDAPYLNNPRAWAWLAALAGCPALNLLGLFKIFGRATAIPAAVYNGGMVFVWGFLIFLMMVWPLGTKPTGPQMVAAVVSWLILVLTEVVLIQDLVHRKPAHPEE